MAYELVRCARCASWIFLNYLQGLIMEQHERVPNLIMLTFKTIKKQLTKAPNAID